MAAPRKYPPEVRERAVRLVLDHAGEYDTQWAAITSIAGKFGMSGETLRKRVSHAEVDGGRRSGVTSAEQLRIRESAPVDEPMLSSGRR